MQKMLETDVIEFARTQLTLPDKIDPADEMSWQHYLYSKLGKTDPQPIEATEKQQPATTTVEKSKEKIIEETVERIVAMAKVLFGLHMVSCPNFFTSFTIFKLIMYGNRCKAVYHGKFDGKRDFRVILNIVY